MPRTYKWRRDLEHKVAYKTVCLPGQNDKLIVWLRSHNDYKEYTCDCGRKTFIRLTRVDVMYHDGQFSNTIHVNELDTLEELINLQIDSNGIVEKYIDGKWVLMHGDKCIGIELSDSDMITSDMEKECLT